MVRVWSNCRRDAIDACGPVVALSETVFKSVQEAGINERLPSGNTSNRRNWPCRWLQPKIANALPSSGWRGRIIRTRSG
jgi:hypothetical protein